MVVKRGGTFGAWLVFFREGEAPAGGQKKEGTPGEGNELRFGSGIGESPFLASGREGPNATREKGLAIEYPP